MNLIFLQDGKHLCSLGQSPHQVIYNLYNVIALTEIKGYAMIQFSYMIMRLYGQGNFTTGQWPLLIYLSNLPKINTQPLLRIWIGKNSIWVSSSGKTDRGQSDFATYVKNILEMWSGSTNWRRNLRQNHQFTTSKPLPILPQKIVWNASLHFLGSHWKWNRFEWSSKLPKILWTLQLCQT